MLHVYASARQEIEQRIEHRGEGDNSMVFYPEQGIAPEGITAPDKLVLFAVPHDQSKVSFKAS